MRILLVEDEQRLNLALKKGLSQKGYAVDSAFDGQEGQFLAENEEYDLIILDILLPKKDGVEVCRYLRENGVNAPIIFLTAKDDVDSRVVGLDSGADDYLVKPFEFSELLARVRALLRRPKQTLPIIVKSGGLLLDSQSHVVEIAGRKIDLTIKEFSLLEYLMRNRNRVVTREQILNHVWNREADTFSNTVDAHVKNLRKKLKGDYAKCLETVRGLGYRFVG